MERVCTYWKRPKILWCWTPTKDLKIGGYSVRNAEGCASFRDERNG